MKKYLSLGALIVILSALAWALSHSGSRPAPQTSTSYKNAQYVIDDAPFVLGMNGTKYFGDEAVGDLNGDGRPDTAFLFTSQPGGSGTFYYVAAGLNTANGYVGTNAVLLGDRIAPQAVMIQNNGILVSYATRRDNEPMTTTPHIMVSSYYQFENGKLVYKGSR